MRAELGSKCRKSLASDCREISASAPAISTPVGPPPIMTNVSSRSRRTGSVSRSARSNASSTRRRMSSASSSVFRPGRAPRATRRGRSRRASRRSRRSDSRRKLAVGQHQPPVEPDRWRARRRAAPRRSLAAQDPADRRRDVARRQRRHRHLIEQRLEDVMVAAVDDRDANARHAAARGPRRARRTRRR